MTIQYKLKKAADETLIQSLNEEKNQLKAQIKQLTTQSVDLN